MENSNLSAMEFQNLDSVPEKEKIKDDDEFESMLRLDKSQFEEDNSNDLLLKKDYDVSNGNSEEDHRTSFLASLSNDVEHYRKKVQLKRNAENPHLEKEKEIVKELEREREEERVQEEDVDENANHLTSVNENEDQNISDQNEVSVDSKLTAETAILQQKRQVDDEDYDSSSSDKRPKLHQGKKVYAWTRAEDEAIVYYKEEMKYSWKKIEQELAGRHSWQAIQMRYLRNHKSRNDEWSRFMEIKLINAIRKDWENRWKRIGQELGRDFGAERCITKNMEICKKMEMPYYSQVFQNKEITTGYKNPFNDIKDAEAHKKLMLVYMGLDAISYEDSDDEKTEAINPSQQDVSS
ncbi:hypothetical protein DAMA08_023120 [Martiniozyma asiatica (nom. inval.)]|nr:hypothetical protein DAMA08_023120 [Martiniozyma asiatica]